MKSTNLVLPTNKRFYRQRSFLFTIFKRFMDIFGSLFLIIIFSPLLLITSALIYIYSPGPIFFKQKRVGKNNIQFCLFKFRTMYTGDNDKRLKSYPELYKRYIQNDWKLGLWEDPRTTPIGKIVRLFSIDEFPQVINILKGEMSLVGPRAYREEELQDYQRRYPHTTKFIEIIRTAKPGLTGLWQTSGRNNLSFEERAKLDANYIVNRSFLQEIGIILKTPFCMISRW